MDNTRHGAHGPVRVPRALLQWPATTFGAGLSQSPSVRAHARTGSSRKLTRVSTKLGQVHLGHADPRMTMRYAHLSDARLREAVRSLDHLQTGAIPGAISAIGSKK